MTEEQSTDLQAIHQQRMHTAKNAQIAGKISAIMNDVSAEDGLLIAGLLYTEAADIFLSMGQTYHSHDWLRTEGSQNSPVQTERSTHVPGGSTGVRPNFLPITSEEHRGLLAS